MCTNVVHNSELPICSKLVNYVRRVTILPTKHSQTLASHSLQHYSTANLLFVRVHADKVDLMGVVSPKVGVVKQFFFSALRAPNNANPPFQNPGSATDIHAIPTHVESINNFVAVINLKN